MSMPSSRAIAEDFIRDQFAIMKRFGKEPQLSDEQRQKLVAATTRSFESLRPRPERQKRATHSGAA